MLHTVSQADIPICFVFMLKNPAFYTHPLNIDLYLIFTSLKSRLWTCFAIAYFYNYRRLRNARTRLNTEFFLLQNKTTPH